MPNIVFLKKVNTVVSHVLLKVKTCTQPLEVGLENLLAVLEHSQRCPVSHFSEWLPSHFCGSYPSPLFSSILPSVAVLLLSGNS